MRYNRSLLRYNRSLLPYDMSRASVCVEGECLCKSVCARVCMHYKRTHSIYNAAAASALAVCVCVCVCACVCVCVW